MPCCNGVQARAGREQVAQARREVRQAVVRQAEVVACTLSAAGGDLATLLASGPLFDLVVIDEVCLMGRAGQGLCASMWACTSVCMYLF